MTVKREDGKEEFAGKVLKLLRRSPNDAWYTVHALVWNEEKGGPEEIYLYTGPYGDPEATAKVDATPEVRGQFAKWLESASPELQAQYK